MTLKKPGYGPRLEDERVDLMLKTFGAVDIEGPKYSGIMAPEPAVGHTGSVSYGSVI